MSARSYLSIGDVLTLLRHEFPDITISKIRFLESQGLVNPERTPSGYRKFYEHDVERLRWVLRQQREHFLPLKVIKDRLDDDGSDTGSAAVDAEGVAPVEAGPAADPGPEPVPATADEEPVLVGQRAASVAGSTPTGTGRPPVPSVTTSSASDEPLPHPVPGEATTTSSDTPSPPRSTPPPPAPDAAANGSGNGTTHRARSPRAPTPTGGRTVRSPKAPKAPVASGAPEDPASVPTAAGSGGASLSMDELMAASGLTDELVRQLEEYGLLSVTMIAGAPFYDEEALTVATVAAQFAGFGIEARHLRLYKNAADREAGFVEQVVIPMVRQRNPEARARAAQTADELAALGQQLRGSLLRSALRQLLNG